MVSIQTNMKARRFVIRDTAHFCPAKPSVSIISARGATEEMTPPRSFCVKLWPLAFLAVWVAGCAAQKPVLDDAFQNQLGPRTSSGNILDALGRPTFIHNASDGSRALGYVRRCPGTPSSEPCKSAPQNAPWQICEIRFTKSDRYDGLACSWAASP
jgi:hypothetical protein